MTHADLFNNLIDHEIAQLGPRSVGDCIGLALHIGPCTLKAVIQHNEPFILLTWQDHSSVALYNDASFGDADLHYRPEIA